MPELTDLLNLLAVTMTDVRATIDAQRRAVGHAQTTLERYRFAPDASSLQALDAKLNDLGAQSAMVSESVAEARRLVAAVVAQTRDVSPPEPAEPAGT